MYISNDLISDSYSVLHKLKSKGRIHSSLKYSCCLSLSERPEANRSMTRPLSGNVSLAVILSVRWRNFSTMFTGIVALCSSWMKFGNNVTQPTYRVTIQVV